MRLAWSGNRSRQRLTGVGVILLVIGNQQSIVLAGGGLVGESLVLDFVQLDHFGRVEWGLKEINEDDAGGTEREFGRSDFFAGKAARKLGPAGLELHHIDIQARPRTTNHSAIFYKSRVGFYSYISMYPRSDAWHCISGFSIHYPQ